MQQEFKPDIVMFNSTVWDVARYEVPFQLPIFEQNVNRACSELRNSVVNCTFIWLHQPPVNANCSRGADGATRELVRDNVVDWILKAVNRSEELCKANDFYSIDLYNLMKDRTSWLGELFLRCYFGRCPCELWY